MLRAPALPSARVPSSLRGFGSARRPQPWLLFGECILYRKKAALLFLLFMKEPLVKRLGTGTSVLHPCPEARGLADLLSDPGHAP